MNLVNSLYLKIVFTCLLLKKVTLLLEQESTDLLHKIMQVDNTIIPNKIAYRSNTNNYNQDSLRVMYEVQKEECSRIKLITASGLTHEFYRPLLGSLILEHDGVRTFVQKFGAWGKQASFTTYEPVSMEIEYD